MWSMAESKAKLVYKEPSFVIDDRIQAKLVHKEPSFVIDDRIQSEIGL